MCFAEGEEFVQLRSGLGRIADEQRLSLPLKPEVFVKAGLIEIEDDVLRLTPAGALLSNEVFSAFL